MEFDTWGTLESVSRGIEDGSAADLCRLLSKIKKRSERLAGHHIKLDSFIVMGSDRNAEIEPGASESTETKGFQQEVNIEKDRE